MCGKRDPECGEWEEESTEKINIDIWERGEKNASLICSISGLFYYNVGFWFKASCTEKMPTVAPTLCKHLIFCHYRSFGGN